MPISRSHRACICNSAASAWGSHMEAVTVFARALGAARSVDLEAARQALGRLEDLYHTLVITQRAEWATQVEIQQRIATAWIARAEHRHEEAVCLMRIAVALDALHNRPSVMPGPLAPMRELLAELLLERGLP
jgi:hypothetical protein